MSRKTFQSKMSLQNQSFHPKLIIVDHFDDLINRIDIHTEFVLEEQSLTEREKIEINDVRAKQIEEINEMKELSLNHLQPHFNEDEYSQKWAHVIDDNSLEYKNKIDVIKEELILEDCVLLGNPNQINAFDCWLTSWFHNEKNLEFLHFILKE